MNNNQKELLDLTQRYITAKNKLEGLERQYKALYARLYLQERILGMKMEAMRENEMTNILENENRAFLDELYTQRGIAKECFYKREALVICMKMKPIQE